MITKSMYSRAIRLQDEQELLPIAYVLNTWLKIIEDDFNERGLGGTALNRHPLVIMLAHKMSVLVFPKRISPTDLRMIPGVYLRFLVQWLINILNDHTCELAITVVDNRFLNFMQLVRWIVIRIAEATYCMNPDIFSRAHNICKYVSSLSESEGYKELQINELLHNVSILDVLPSIPSHILYDTLQTFQKVISDATLIQALNKTTLPIVAEQKRNLTLC